MTKTNKICGNPQNLCHLVVYKTITMQRVQFKGYRAGTCVRKFEVRRFFAAVDWKVRRVFAAVDRKVRRVFAALLA